MASIAEIMPTKKRKQHFVPKSYLKRFSARGEGKAIGVFNVLSNEFIRSGALKSQAYKRYFYGVDGRVEDALCDVEGAAATLFSHVICSGSVPPYGSESHLTILLFTLIQHSRTTYASEEMNEMTDKVIKQVYGKDPRVKDHLDKFTIGCKDAPGFLMGNVMAFFPVLFDLHFKLLLNVTPKPFIMSDNPVVLYNQFLETRKTDGGITGLACKGLQIFMPISPQHCIIFYDKDVYAVGNRQSREVHVEPADVVALNQLQCINCLENIYFNEHYGESDVRKLVQSVKAHRRPVKAYVHEFPGKVKDDGHRTSLLMTHRADIRCGLKLDFMRLVKKAKLYDMGSRVFHARNEELLRQHEEMLALRKRARRQ